MVTLNASHLFSRSFEPLFEKRRRLLPGLNDSFDCINCLSVRENKSENKSNDPIVIVFHQKRVGVLLPFFPGEHCHKEVIAFFALNLPSKLHQRVLIVLC